MVEECDPEDIACQARVIKHLRGLAEELGVESLHEQFPEFDGLQGTITEKLRARKDVMKSTLVNCGIIEPDESLEDVLRADAEVADAEVDATEPAPDTETDAAPED